MYHGGSVRSERDGRNRRKEEEEEEVGWERRQGDRQLAAPSSAGILSLTGWLGTPDKRR